jgi:hypothetical protein
MPVPLLGFALQSFVPPAQPYAISSAAPLMPFGVRGSQVRSARLPLQAEKRGHHQAAHGNPGFKGLRRARVRYARKGIGLHGARSSPGLRLFRAFPFAALRRLPPTLPSCGYARGRTLTAMHPLQGFAAPRSWLVSLETAGPPEVCHLATPHRDSRATPARVTSAGAEARHRPLHSSHTGRLRVARALGVASLGDGFSRATLIRCQLHHWSILTDTFYTLFFLKIKSRALYALTDN